MHITLERIGGFTGAPLTITVDTATLSSESVSQLHHLVEAADFFYLPERIATPAQPDRYEYEITICQGDRTHTITRGEAAVSASLKPLLKWLLKTAQ